jgi:hypothetical protein
MAPFFYPVGAAAGCDLLILCFEKQIKRSQPAAAPTGLGKALNNNISRLLLNRVSPLRL